MVDHVVLKYFCCGSIRFHPVVPCMIITDSTVPQPNELQVTLHFAGQIITFFHAIIFVWMYIFPVYTFFLCIIQDSKNNAGKKRKFLSKRRWQMVFFISDFSTSESVDLKLFSNSFCRSCCENNKPGIIC